nr:sodium-dependent proline transporter-like [Penaeus vannamei]
MALTAPCIAVSIGYALLYLVYSFSYVHLWGFCDNAWNTGLCVDMVTSNMSQGYMVVPAFEFYTRFILAAPGGGLSWPQSFAALLVWVIVFLALFCGVKVLGKVMWVTAGTSLVLLIVMFLRGVTLPCAWGGIRHLVQFDSHSLLDYNTWGFASANILYTYFFGFGIYTTLGSFSHFRHSFLRDVLAVSAASFAMEILSAMAVWSVLGYLMCAMGIPMEEATSTGAYLIYGTLPQALCKTSQPMLWSALFFLMMFLLAISSFIVLVQVLVAIVSTGLRRWCRKRWLLVLAVCGPGFCISLVYCSEKGGEWLSLVDGFAAIVTPLVVCLLEVIVFVYIYGAGRLARDVEMLSNTFVSYYCYFTWIATVPLVLLLILASHLLMMIRSSMYFLAISTTLAIPIFSLFYVFRSVFCKMLQGAATPWGPKAPSDRAAWERFCAERPVRRRFFHRRF